MRIGSVIGSVIAVGLALVIALAPRDSPAPAPADEAQDSTAPRAARFAPLTSDFSAYVWPTDAGRSLTSTFGEFRRSHFHGGIDIRTHDRTGFRVLAAERGYVARISVSPTGYGKMLFVQHPDGYVTTYAHLDRFADRIQARVEEEQHRLERYPVSISCGAGEFPVGRGEQIAYSGETGTGTPHLHFEIRDRYGDAVNPLLSPAFVIEDTIPPTLHSIAVLPLGENAQVNGSSVPVLVPIPQGSTPHAHLQERIRITGAAGFAIRVRDRSNGSWFRHGVYGTRLFVNQQQVYSVTMDRAPMEDGQQIALYYHWPLYERRQGRFQKLFMNTPNELPFYEPRTQDAGVIGSFPLAEGLHTFRIETRDINGNDASVSGEFVFNHPPSFSLESGPQSLTVVPDDPTRIFRVLVSGRRLSGGPWTTSVLRADPVASPGILSVPLDTDRFDIVRVVAENVYGTQSAPAFWVTPGVTLPVASGRLTWEADDEMVRFALATDGIFTQPPVVTLLEGSNVRQIDVRADDIRAYSGAYHPSPDVSGLRTLRARVDINGCADTLEATQEIWPVYPGTFRRLILAGGELLLDFDPGSLFGPAFIRIEMDEEEGAPVYRIHPTHTVLRGPIRAGIRFPGATPTSGVFIRRRRQWSLCGRGPADSAGYLWGRIPRAPGDIAVLTDSTPPVLSALRISRRGDARPVISFRWRDDLSGVDYQSLKLYIDGEACIPEVDGEHRRAVYRPPIPLSRGPHLLKILLKDNLGNTTTGERRFVVG